MRLVNGQLLRRGYTTGTCAAAASGAAAAMLLRQSTIDKYELTTPNNFKLSLCVEDVKLDATRASCAVRKDFSDDPDVTKGIAIYAEVTLCDEGIVIKGGGGVGRVTKKGLDQDVGEAAINSTPRRMIKNECAIAAKNANYRGGFIVTISVPEGEALALKTFNPRVGIVGGISILGTTGIVEPMSEKAYIESLRLDLRQLYAEGKRDVLIIVGNFAKQFAKENLNLSLDSYIKCSNFIGEAFSAAAKTGFKRALLIGHIGKLVKLGLGILNTHSSVAGGRMETLVVCALEAGAPLELLHNIASCVSTDAALDLLREGGILTQTMNVLQRRIEETLKQRTSIGHSVNLESGFICFAKTSSAPIAGEKKEGGVVATSGNAKELSALFHNGANNNGAS
jgi:cobalt-precorrin-5B (C1)-methyltransferase